MDEHYIIVVPHAGFDLRNGYLAIFMFDRFDILSAEETDEYISQYMTPALAIDPDGGQLVFGIKFKSDVYMNDAAKALGIGEMQTLDVAINPSLYDHIERVNKTSSGAKYKTMFQWWGEIPEHYFEAYRKTGDFWRDWAKRHSGVAQRPQPQTQVKQQQQQQQPQQRQQIAAPPRNTAPMIVRQQQPVARQVMQQSTVGQQRRRF
jgi:hypothetical protein